LADYTVGRSEGVSYPNNNLTYRQFIKENKLSEKQNCTTCKFENVLKLKQPCNFCSLNPGNKNNWESINK
jgi:hypothetical protein